MFEKYDGVRGFWNPSRKTMFSRRGNVVTLPADVINTLPKDILLDGELWYLLFYIPVLSFYSNLFQHRFGRENFQESLKMCSRIDPSGINWAAFRYMVFDLPNNKGTYEERYRTLGIN